MATDGTSSGNAPPPHVEHEQGDLAFTRESPYGTLGEATFAGALSFVADATASTPLTQTSRWSVFRLTWRPPVDQARVSAPEPCAQRPR